MISSTDASNPVLSDPVMVNWSELNCQASASNPLSLVFCAARIDNRRELAARLSLTPQSANENLILAAYEQFGEQCPDYILGDFAFAIVDYKRKCIFAARDIMGCQPVYFFPATKGFAIATSIKKLLEVPGVNPAPNDAFIAASLSYAYVDHEQTYFAGIRKIPCAKYLIANQKSCELYHYWRPEDVSDRSWQSAAVCEEELRELLILAISDRLPAHGRTGVHVSGGLDCSSIAILTAESLRQANREPPVALTWYPPPNENITDFEKREYERISSVCSLAGVTPIYTVQTVENILKVLDRDHMIRPICNASYNESLVLKEANRHGVTTILSGFGGDETASFNGRGYYHRLALSGSWLELSRIAKSMGQPSLRFCAAQLYGALCHLCLSDRALLQLQGATREEGFAPWIHFKRLLAAVTGLSVANPVLGHNSSDAYERAPYLNQYYVDNVQALPPIPPVRLTNDRIARNQLLRWNANVGRIESWAADGALHGIQYAHPFLDRRVVEFSLSLPGHVFRDATRNRLFFRRAMQAVLPENVLSEESKDDPARSNPLINCLKQAYVQIGEHLEQHGTGSPKAAYLDMSRLREDLKPEAVNNRNRLGRLIQAIEFLGVRGL